MRAGHGPVFVIWGRSTVSLGALRSKPSTALPDRHHRRVQYGGGELQERASSPLVQVWNNRELNTLFNLELLDSHVIYYSPLGDSLKRVLRIHKGLAYSFFLTYQNRLRR